jgi:hypothetical protein
LALKDKTMRKRALHSETAPVGYGDFLNWQKDKTADWGFLAIRAELEAVEDFYRSLGWTIGGNIPKLMEMPAQFVSTYGILQPVGRGYEWIVVTYPWHQIDRAEISRQAQLAAKQLTTKTFWTTTIGNHITYELLDWGNRAEYAELSDTFTFESQLRNQPGENFLDGELIDGFPKFQFLIDEIFADLHIYLFPCTVLQTDGGYGYVESPDTQVMVAQVKQLNPS